MIHRITFLLFFLISGLLHSQVGIGTKIPNSDSVLEISSDTKAVLITRVSLTGTYNPSPLNNHVAGMIVYNTAPYGTGNTAVFEGFYYNDGIKWNRLEPLTIAIGDIKHSLLTEDHNGWYKLDGRTTTSLPSRAAVNAASIGFITNIPDATDKFLKGKSSSEALMSSGGNNSTTLSQANLPNISFNGTANTSGNHTHNFTDQYHGESENLNLVTSLLGALGGTLLNILDNNVGAEVLSSATSTTSLAGNHSHTASVNTGGISAPIGKVSHLVTNTFVYLGK